jgi:SAM-dependent methyltransferase
MKQPRAHDEYAVVAEFYDHAVPYRDRKDVNFFVEIAREANGPVLEVGCGTGRVLIPTARAGVEIVGLDASASMLSFCREKLLQEPEEVQARVEIVWADMREFDLGREFALVTTPFRPFQHLTSVKGQIACLACVHRHLANGGRLVLDIFNPDLSRLIDEQYLNEWEEEPEVKMPDGRTMIRKARVVWRDLFSQVQEVELAHHVKYPDGREEAIAQRFPLRYFFRYEAEHLLARSGFEVEHVYADYDKSPYGSQYPGEMIFVAKKI